MSFTGCGILNEPTAETPDPYNKENPEVLVDEILKKMEDLMENTEELDLNEVARRFESTNKEAKDILVYRRSRSSTSASVSSDSPDDQEIKFIEPAKYTTDMDFQYVDYVKRSNPNESPTFREQVKAEEFLAEKFWQRKSFVAQQEIGFRNRFKLAHTSIDVQENNFWLFESKTGQWPWESTLNWETIISQN